MRHRCDHADCHGADNATIFRQVEKNGLAVVVVVDAIPLTAYTVGLYASHNVPELYMQFALDFDADAAMMVITLTLERLLDSLGVPLFSPRRRQRKMRLLNTTAPLSITPGREVVLRDDLSMYLWPEDTVTVAMRPTMTATAAYYREYHITSFDRIPVWLVSWQPLPLCDQHKNAMLPRPPIT